MKPKTVLNRILLCGLAVAAVLFACHALESTHTWLSLFAFLPLLGMAEMTIYKDNDVIDRTTPTGGWTSGECLQLPDGRAAFIAGLKSPSAGDPAGLKTSGQVTVPKIATKYAVAGSKAWWDRSSSHATPIRTSDSFFIGVFVLDAATTATAAVVNLNVRPSYQIEQGVGEWTNASTNGLGAVAQPGGNEVKLAFDAVAEAAMAALYSADTVPVADGPIFEADVAIYDIGDAAALDISVGLANGTHATDFDSVTESAIIHLDGTDLSINAESDDGTTEVAATDTTVDAVDDTYFHLLIDCRDDDDIQYHIDGVPVLGSTAFKLDAATGPLLAIAHIEKTSDDTTADVRVKNMCVRSTDLP